MFRQPSANYCAIDRTFDAIIKTWLRLWQEIHKNYLIACILARLTEQRSNDTEQKTKRYQTQFNLEIIINRILYFDFVSDL